MFVYQAVDIPGLSKDVLDCLFLMSDINCLYLLVMLIDTQGFRECRSQGTSESVKADTG